MNPSRALRIAMTLLAMASCRLAVGATEPVSCAAPEVALGASFAAFSALPASLLVSRRGVPYGVHTTRQGDSVVATLARITGAGASLPMARIVATGNEIRPHICIDLQLDASPEWARTTVERLYGMVLSSASEGVYCIADSRHRCDESRSGLSQAGALRELSLTHGRLPLDGIAPVRTASWQGVTLDATVEEQRGDEVQVLIADAGGPLAGVTAFFNKAPHMSCRATSGADGVATCRLVDQHPDDDSEEESSKSNLLVTFPGVVDEDRILLPTTLIVSVAK